MGVPEPRFLYPLAAALEHVGLPHDLVFDSLLHKAAQNLSALDTKALALCGLALCGDPGQVAAAVEAYKAARRISRAAGATASALKTFDALAEADAEGLLTEVRQAAAGQ